MALNIKIDFENRYEPLLLDNDFRFSTFESILVDGEIARLGVDGSNTARAYMYYRCVQNNFEYLDSFFTIYGVNYYLRVLRDGSNDYDPEDLLAIPKLIVKGENILPQKLFNYFIFNLK